MTYTPQYPAGWRDLPDTSTPIIAAALNKIDAALAADDASIAANAANIASALATITTHTGQISALQTSVAAMLAKVAATPYPGGYALINGTGVVTGCTWTAPSDGAQHRVLVFAELQVTSTETGGVIQLQFTDPGGNVVNTQVEAGAQGTGPTAGTVKAVPVQAGSTTTLRQTGALTAGAATLWAELWAS